MLDGRKRSDFIRAFKNWVAKCDDNPYGCVFTDNMIIPLNINLSPRMGHAREWFIKERKILEVIFFRFQLFLVVLKT